jgi:D-alanyl-lipoteichoic acid acyltransferase DltB (MBOAT superfamily)
MLFQTPTFGLFLVVVVAVATLLDGRAKLHQGFLLVASWLFYAAWDVRFLGLIVFSTFLDYFAALAIARAATPGRRRALLAVSLAGNLGLLGLFKYFDFFAESVERLLAALGVEASLPLLHLILPVGISFYTFQTLSYTIDVYRGTLEPRRSPVQFALFVAFFPQLVAGPIVRASEFLPQLDEPRRYDDLTTGSGIYLILKGLVKKVVFADVLGTYLVNPVFADPAAHPGFWVLLAVYAFKFQIYGDFSGYSDVAIGCGRLLGFELPENFRSPFKSTSFTEYWRRWHMTLGSWFRD